MTTLQEALEKIADALPAYIDGVAAREYLAVVHAALEQQGAPAAYITDTEQGPMVWTPEMYGEACTYCDDGEFPVPLYTRPMPAQDAEIAALKSALRTTIRTYVVDDDAWDPERETERFMKRAIDAAIEGAK